MLKDSHSQDKQALVVVVSNKDEPYGFFIDTINQREAVEISQSAGFVVKDTVSVRIRRPSSRSYIGQGKIEHIAELLQENPDISSVILSREISPSQQKNLQEIWQRPVHTKNQLIHRIFAARAHTSEGKIKVELADLRYQLSRLPGKGKDMSRTGGGIGTRGPGEQKIESTRRSINQRISRLSRQLKKINQRRSLNKARRLSRHIPQIAIVGYTNAGKSTLLNALTGSEVQVEDQMFATLHPIVRKRYLADIGEVIFADTVGFIREMPATLKEAFRATIEEITEADLILELLDITDPSYYLHYQVIDQTLREIGAAAVPRIVVLNKCDQIPGEFPLIEPDIVSSHPTCFVSARSGQNLDELLSVISQLLGGKSDSSASYSKYP